MQALSFLVDTLLGLCSFVFLLRLLLQWVRGDFRNPLARSILQLTNPVILPLRRLVPAAGRMDSASVIAVLALTALRLVALAGLSPFPMPSGTAFLHLLLVELARLLLQSYLYLILLYAITSFVSQDAYSPGRSLLASLCEPVLRPVRRRLPALSGLDLSPLVVLLAIQALLLLIR
jgi:YggT family protein